MAITTRDVLNVAPELAEAAPDRLQWAVDLANADSGVVNEGRLGIGKANLARAYFAAHLLVVKSTGAVTSESAGGVSRSYAAPKDGGSAYLDEYRRLARVVGGLVS